MLTLIQFLNKIHPLDESIQQYLLHHLKQKRLKSGDFWHRKCQICSTVAFIEEGLVKSVYQKNERNYINWFMSENDVIISVRSFFEQIPSRESLIAVEPTILYYITYEEYKYLVSHHPAFHMITTSLLSFYYEKCQDRTELLRLYRNERYQEFMLNESDLASRISGRDMAAYLGISEERLSKMKSEQIL